MGGTDINTVDGRLAIARLIFDYPPIRETRRHGPDGYGPEYESYRDWLRDEFSYRCAFSLIRENWIGKKAHFHIDHLIPQSEDVSLILEYDNLVYLTASMNLTKSGKRGLPSPQDVNLSESLRVHTSGNRRGEIEALTFEGALLIQTLRLDNEDMTSERQKWLAILESVARNDEPWFRNLVGFPEDIPNLNAKRPPSNSKPEGIEESAFALRERGELPDWY